MTDLLGPYGSGEYGLGPYGGAYPPYGLESATALSPNLVRLRYTSIFDVGFPALTSIANYHIFPALTVYTVIIESVQTVLLITSTQSDVVYTVTIDDARGYFGQPLDPALDSATFTGIPISPSFVAVATRKTRVRAIFSEAMLLNATLVNPAKYVLTDLNFNPIPILSVTPEQSSDIISTMLTLGADLTDERHYLLRILSGFVTAHGVPLTPSTAVFQWVENTQRISIPLEAFSGETQEGLLGEHSGLVFFSPALETSAANSIIQVDSVYVCTRAYDEYQFPQMPDPAVLFTHGSGITATPSVTVLNSNVLWAKFPRLSEATLELENHLADTVPTAVSGPCDATLTEPWDLDYVSLQNNVAWKIFDNAGTPPRYFITADNLAPIPSGSTVTYNLEP